MRTFNQDHFGLYEHRIKMEDNQIITRYLIVLKRATGELQFTDFHKYVYPVKNSIRSITSDDRSRFVFVTGFLNYAFFECGITRLCDLKVTDAQKYMNAYAMCKLPGDKPNVTRNKQTVKRCASYIFDFYTELIRQNVIQAKESSLYTYAPSRDKRGKYVDKRVPVFSVECLDKQRPQLLRDMPDSVFRIVFQYAAENHPEIFGLIFLQAFAGLRPSEACNVRRVDSPLGPGIMFSMYNGKVDTVTIDLTSEKVLRSDLKKVGNIKKERQQRVPHIFLNGFVISYNIYMDYLNGRKYEKDYGPFSINTQGKAISYASYRSRFQGMMDEIRPILLQSNDPELVRFGQLLFSHKVSPHIFRHWYTVQLVLSGVSNPAELMVYRGDHSPESALTYLRDKGELLRQYKRINAQTFDYLTWASERQKKCLN